MIECKIKVTLGSFILDTNFKIPGDGITVIYGPSGSGKTTLLRAIAGLEKNQDGFLKVGNLIWQDELNFVETHKRQIGYVFQDAALFEHLNVRGNLDYVIKRSPGLSKDYISSIYSLLDIESLIDRDTNQLSGGEKQRVQIARVLAQIWSVSQGTCLFLDEPLTSLDLAHQLMLMRLLKTLATGGHCICVVLHDLNLAMRYGDLIALLNGSGELAEFGEPPAVLTPQVIKAIFGVKTTLQPSQFNDRPGLLFE